ncbi:MAG: Na(+)/H(+) antiporter subunit D [Mariniblastus sp.]|nr:Na(+)/H(+) antiporter subunit D [Mariniblastus sp.]
MIHSLPPGLIMVLGALLLPFLGRKLSAWGALAFSLASLSIFLTGQYEHPVIFELFGNQLEVVRVDRLSWIFCLVFHLAAIMASIYALHVKDTKQHVAGLIYAGSAIAASCAGDLITLFICWELTAISSVFLIWASNSERAYRCGMRYLIIQVISGVLLLSGAIIQFNETGSLGFNNFLGFEGPGRQGSILDLGLGPQLILLAFGIKGAFPFLHNWLQDSYPEATPTGTVYLSAFTTKLAIYSLARGFAGLEELIWIGCAMTLFPIVFAVIENDLRRVLAYSLNNQLGFMVVGIGIGTELALNGTAAHAFCHIIYKALLFMSMGAVLHRVGTTKATELGGLHKSMPLTTVFCMIGAGAISGFPLLSGFISKSMIISAAGEQHLFVVWTILLIASAGVMEHSGIKIPFFAFFAHDSGKRPKEAPWNMLLAMSIGAFLCVALGFAYHWLYDILPYEMGDHPYQPYTSGHVIMQLQLLLFAALAFVVLMKSNLYPAEIRSTNLDTDWIYRKLLPWIVTGIGMGIALIDGAIRKMFLAMLTRLLDWFKQIFSQKGALGSTWTTSVMAFWAAILLGAFLVLYYFSS